MGTSYGPDTNYTKKNIQFIPLTCLFYVSSQEERPKGDMKKLLLKTLVNFTIAASHKGQIVLDFKERPSDLLQEAY